MNKKKVIFWGVIVTSVIFMFNFLHGILGGKFAGGSLGRHGRPAEMGHAGGYGPHGRFGGHHQFMGGPHLGGGIPWLAILIGLAVLILLVRWLRKKGKTSSMNEFIDTSILSSQTPVMTQNARLLDEWEKNITNKKENE